MAVPKGKQSKSRTNSRFANYKATAPTLVECPHCHSMMQAHRVCVRQHPDYFARSSLTRAALPTLSRR